MVFDIKLKDLIKKAYSAQKIINDRNLPLWEILHKSLAVYDKIILTDLPDEIKKELESSFGRINHILSRYEIAKFKDYERMSGDDLLDAIKIVADFSNLVIQKGENC